MRLAKTSRRTRAGVHTLQNFIHDARKPTFPEERSRWQTPHPLTPRRTDARPGRLGVGKRRVTSLAGSQRVHRAFTPARRAGLPALRPASSPQPLQGRETLLLRREPLSGAFAESARARPVSPINGGGRVGRGRGDTTKPPQAPERRPQDGGTARAART